MTDTELAPNRNVWDAPRRRTHSSFGSSSTPGMAPKGTYSSVAQAANRSSVSSPLTQRARGRREVSGGRFQDWGEM